MVNHGHASCIAPFLERYVAQMRRSVVTDLRPQTAGFGKVRSSGKLRGAFSILDSDSAKSWTVSGCGVTVGSRLRHAQVFLNANGYDLPHPAL
jgi:hypothetical protein